MARLFDDASSQYAENASAVLSGVPITVAACVYPDAVSRNQSIFGIFDTAGTAQYFDLFIDNVDRVVAATKQGGENSARTVATVSVNTWHHVAAVFAAINDRAAFLDGANKVSDANTRTPVGLDITSIGRRGHSAPALYFSGRIAEVGVWNVALTDDEILSLAKGMPPCMVRPANLVPCWELMGTDSPEPDANGGFPMTLYASPTKADHPPGVFRPAPGVY